MRRFLTLTALLLLAFTSAAYGQHIDRTPVELGGEDSVRIEAVGFVGPVPSRVVFSTDIAEFEFNGHTVVRIVFVYDVFCAEGTLEPLRYVLMDPQGMTTRPFSVEKETVTPEADSALSAVLTYVCKQTYNPMAVS